MSCSCLDSLVPLYPWNLKFESRCPNKRRLFPANISHFTFCHCGSASFGSFLLASEIGEMRIIARLEGCLQSPREEQSNWEDLRLHLPDEHGNTPTIDLFPAPTKTGSAKWELYA